MNPEEKMSDKIHTTVCTVCGSTDIESFLICEDYLATKEKFEISKCKACAFAFTQDFPSENVIGRYYDAPEYVSHSDTRKGIIHILYHWVRQISLKSKAKLVSEYSGMKKGMLLDIGSGTGYFLNKMKCKEWNVAGIEKSEEARKYTRQKFDIVSQEPEFLYTIPRQSKDVVTMWHVLEHLQHPERVLTHIRDILKDDGTLIIALPNKASSDAAHYKQFWAAFDVPRHLWHFSPSDFKHLASKHRFEVIDIKPMYFDTFYISMLSEKNKGSFSASLTGLIRGGIFFLRSIGKPERVSSLIYILKKTTPPE